MKPQHRPDLWQLPRSTRLAGREWRFRADFRDILQLMRLLERPDCCQQGRIYLAMRLFYPDFNQMPVQAWPQAAQAMLEFVSGGTETSGPAGPRLLDWQQDADLIVSDVNRVAGCEIRALPFVHWWTFLGWFGAIGEGRLSAVVAVRSKLAEGRPLEDWEQEFYRRNRQRIQLAPLLTPEQQAEKERLEAMLNKAERRNQP